MPSSVPVSIVSQLAARSAIGAALVAILALAALHLLRRDLDPAWHMISEYAIGANGWVMGLSFLAFAASSAALAVALIGHVPTWLGKIGFVFLLAAMVGTAMGGLFPMDPVETDQARMSFSGRMHGVGFMVGVPGELFCVLLLSLALRGQSLWAGQPLIALTAVLWISLIVMVAALMAFMKTQVMEGPGLLGWTNRAFMVSYALWIVAAAWPLAKDAG